MCVGFIPISVVAQVATVIWVGAITFIELDYYRGYNVDQNNNVSINLSIDPGMAYYQSEFDYRGRVGYLTHNIEPFILYEHVGGKIKYTGYTFGCNYMLLNSKCSLFIGPEITKIYNINGKISLEAISTGMNLETRILFKNGVSLSVFHNLKSRPELISKKYVYSFYIGLGYNLIKI